MISLLYLDKNDSKEIIFLFSDIVTYLVLLNMAMDSLKFLVSM
jgi:hypothetical protein